MHNITTSSEQRRVSAGFIGLTWLEPPVVVPQTGAVQARLCPSHGTAQAQLGCPLLPWSYAPVGGVEAALVHQPQVPCDAPILILALVLATDLGHTLHSCPYSSLLSLG